MLILRRWWVEKSYNLLRFLLPCQRHIHNTGPEIAKIKERANQTTGGSTEINTKNNTTIKIATKGTLFLRSTSLKLKYVNLLTISKLMITVNMARQIITPLF